MLSCFKRRLTKACWIFSTALIIMVMVLQFNMTERSFRNSETINDYRHSGNPTFIGRHNVHKMYARTYNVKTNTNSNGTGGVIRDCSIYHLAIVCSSSDDVHDIVQLIKSLLEFRTDDVMLYFATNQRLRIILEQLFDTWLLHGVNINFYIEEFDDKVSLTDVKKVEVLFATQRIYKIKQIMFVDPRVRFLEDVRNYFHFVDNYLSQALYVTGSSKELPSNQWWPIVISLDNEITTKQSYWINLTSWIVLTKKLSDWSDRIHPSRSDWTESVINKNITLTPMSYLLPRSKMNFESIMSYSSLPNFNTVLGLHNTPYKKYESVPRTLTCITTREIQKLDILNDECYSFRLETTYTYPTHSNFIEPLIAFNDAADTSEFEVTLITMFTLDRFDKFERLIKAWGDGPVIAIVYAEIPESEKITEAVSRSDIVSTHKYITYHLVYKNGLLTPLNYMRNLGLDSVQTPWLLFDDVDLEPSRELSKDLKNALEQEKMDRGDDYALTAYVIPAFGVKDQPTERNAFPFNKTMLLPFINDKVITGWGQVWGWPYGHRATRYDQWVLADESYEVTYQHLWEPYLVVPSTSVSRYDENLAERLRDKIAYTLALFVEGYTFRVLHELFIIHEPHPIASNWVAMSKDIGRYKRCCFKLYAEYVQRLQYQFPGVAFPNDTMLEQELGIALELVPQEDLKGIPF